MAFWSYHHYYVTSIIPRFQLLGLLSLLLVLLPPPCAIKANSSSYFIPAAHAIRVNLVQKPPPSDLNVFSFREAPAFRNGYQCRTTIGNMNSNSNYSNNSKKNPPLDTIHIVMPLDANYIRGTVAAVFSILRHATCPENVSFHFLTIRVEPEILSLIKSTFPYLNFKIYRFDSNRVRGKISKSVRQALDQPLNYARIYLSDILPKEVSRVIYLDSDVIVVDDISKLWSVDLEDKVLAAPEYCLANFTTYFTDAFWSDVNLTKTFSGRGRRRPCYFNTGVMIVDVENWRRGGYTKKVEKWMTIQKQRRIYHLGSLPPILLVFAGNIKEVEHRWNQHGIGGDNFEGKCRRLHPGAISLLHWSGKGKPWLRLDARKPCTLDYLWAPYDLYRSSRVAIEE